MLQLENAKSKNEKRNAPTIMLQLTSTLQAELFEIDDVDDAQPADDVFETLLVDKPSSGSNVVQRRGNRLSKVVIQPSKPERRSNKQSIDELDNPLGSTASLASAADGLENAQQRGGSGLVAAAKLSGFVEAQLTLLKLRVLLSLNQQGLTEDLLLKNEAHLTSLVQAQDHSLARASTHGLVRDRRRDVEDDVAASTTKPPASATAAHPEDEDASEMTALDDSVSASLSSKFRFTFEEIHLWIVAQTANLRQRVGTYDAALRQQLIECDAARSQESSSRLQRETLEKRLAQQGVENASLQRRCEENLATYLSELVVLRERLRAYEARPPQLLGGGPSPPSVTNSFAVGESADGSSWRGGASSAQSGVNNAEEQRLEFTLAKAQEELSCAYRTISERSQVIKVLRVELDELRAQFDAQRQTVVAHTQKQQAADDVIAEQLSQLQADLAALREERDRLQVALKEATDTSRAATALAAVAKSSASAASSSAKASASKPPPPPSPRAAERILQLESAIDELHAQAQRVEDLHAVELATWRKQRMGLEFEHAKAIGLLQTKHAQELAELHEQLDDALAAQPPAKEDASPTTGSAMPSRPPSAPAAPRRSPSTSSNDRAEMAIARAEVDDLRARLTLATSTVEHQKSELDHAHQKIQQLQQAAALAATARRAGTPPVPTVVTGPPRNASHTATTASTNSRETMTSPLLLSAPQQNVTGPRNSFDQGSATLTGGLASQRPSVVANLRAASANSVKTLSERSGIRHSPEFDDVPAMSRPASAASATSALRVSLLHSTPTDRTDAAAMVMNQQEDAPVIRPRSTTESPAFGQRHHVVDLPRDDENRFPRADERDMPESQRMLLDRQAHHHLTVPSPVSSSSGWQDDFPGLQHAPELLEPVQHLVMMKQLLAYWCQLRGQLAERAALSGVPPGTDGGATDAHMLSIFSTLNSMEAHVKAFTRLVSSTRDDLLRKKHDDVKNILSAVNHLRLTHPKEALRFRRIAAAADIGFQVGHQIRAACERPAAVAPIAPSVNVSAPPPNNNPRAASASTMGVALRVAARHDAARFGLEGNRSPMHSRSPLLVK